MTVLAGKRLSLKGNKIMRRYTHEEEAFIKGLFKPRLNSKQKKRLQYIIDSENLIKSAKENLKKTISFAKKNKLRVFSLSEGTPLYMSTGYKREFNVEEARSLVRTFSEKEDWLLEIINTAKKLLNNKNPTEGEIKTFRYDGSITRTDETIDYMKQMNRDMIKNYKDAELSDEIFRNKRKEINEKSERFVDEASLIEKRLVIELGAKKKTTTKKPATKRKPAARKTTTKTATKRKPSAKKIAEQTFIKSIEDEILNAGRDEDNNRYKIRRYNIDIPRMNELMELETSYYFGREGAAWKRVHEYMLMNKKNTITIFNEDLSMRDVNNKMKKAEENNKRSFERAEEFHSQIYR
jgi:hypothetical protein